MVVGRLHLDPFGQEAYVGEYERGFARGDGDAEHAVDVGDGSLGGALHSDGHAGQRFLQGVEHLARYGPVLRAQGLETAGDEQ